ncbi:peptidoglycan-binding protein [Roseobacter sp. CCS2]|uniref:peptidoglycan-binding protein n=1 Tax=Roseobacter sp. CCS2 TaxID=391593 RepID=UPI001E52059A|nr:peptidoglycan-binding protein [Roseobacter sp. CCS2]
MTERQVSSEALLFHTSGLHRIYLHWTAGARGVIHLEKKAYNGLVDHDCKRHLGKWSFEDQASYRAGVRGASGTLNSNTGCIQLAADAMAGAVEVPFNPGSAPMTWEQVDELCLWSAELSLAFDIPVSRHSILSHAEIQSTLGIRQRFKWDICWLPDMSRPGDPIECGDRLRDIIADKVEVLAFKQAA